MKKYFCAYCNYDAKQKSNYDKHIKTIKHLKCIQMYPDCIQMYPKCIQNVSNEENMVTNKFICKYCNKAYKYSQGLSKHIKYTCKKNEDEDLQELVKLLNEKTNQLSKEIEKRDKKIMKLSNKLQINNGVINNITNNNIKVLNYKDSDLSHLTDKDFVYCIGRTNNSIKALTELIHFNPEKPENMNVFKSNLKNDYITLKQDDVWVVKKYLDDFIEDKELIIEEWLTREEEKYPGLRDKFELFIQNKENENILNTIKENLNLLLYNNRTKIKQIEN